MRCRVSRATRCRRCFISFPNRPKSVFAMDSAVDRDAVWPTPYYGIHSQSAVAFQSPQHPPSPSHLYSASLHPSALHSPSVHITEFSEVANPQPRGKGEGQGEGNPGQDYLSPSKLRELTGQPDLSQVTYLELSINTSENSLGNFGVHLPRLSQLRVEGGVVPCVRDLGTTLSSVTVLWMPRCGVYDLDGLAALSSLQELYLPFNEVCDVSLVAMLPSLEVLDLEGNEVSDLDQLGYLCLCPALSTLTLEGNPITTTLAQEEGSEEAYRSAVHEAIPHLRILDDTPLSDSGRQLEDTPPPSDGPTHALRSESSLFRLSEAGMGEDVQVVMEGIKKGRRRGEREGEGSSTADLSPHLSSTRPKTAPIHALQHTSLQHPVSPSAADDSSELTHGLSQVICGNPVRALKARKKQGLLSQSAILAAPPTSPPPTAQALLSELQDWRVSSTPRLMSVTEGRGATGTPRQASLSESLEAEGITVTKARSQENLLEDDPHPSHSHKRQPVHLSPTPPPGNPPLHHRRLPTTPSHTPSSLPPPRPKSVADFRHRRYRRPNEGSPGRSLSAQAHPSPFSPSPAHAQLTQSRRLLPPPSQTHPHTYSAANVQAQYM